MIGRTLAALALLGAFSGAFAYHHAVSPADCR